jgi:predicted dehydrogenase
MRSRPRTSGAAAVPHQVAFNRRFVPVVQEARRRLAALGPAAVQHLHYEMTRVGPARPDFSTTAIHGLDAVRFLAGARLCARRASLSRAARRSARRRHIFVDAVLTSGATAHLAFCPARGGWWSAPPFTRAGTRFFLRIPMWGPLDAPATCSTSTGTGGAGPRGDRSAGGASLRARRLLRRVRGVPRRPGRGPDALAEPSGVAAIGAIAECVRRRDEEFRA